MSSHHFDFESPDRIDWIRSWSWRRSRSNCHPGPPPARSSRVAEWSNRSESQTPCSGSAATCRPGPGGCSCLRCSRFVAVVVAGLGRPEEQSGWVRWGRRNHRPKGNPEEIKTNL